MKVLIPLWIIFICLFSLSVKAQVNTSQTITLRANFNTSLSLDIQKTPITFDFNTISDLNKGIGDDAQHSTTGEIIATSNWKLSVRALQDLTTDNQQSKLKADNIGLKATFTGTNNVTNLVSNAPAGLSANEKTVLEYNGKDSNAGGKNENSFVVKWEMGTQKGTMNNTPLINQSPKQGSYSTQVEFILTEVL